MALKSDYLCVHNFVCTLWWKIYNVGCTKERFCSNGVKWFVSLTQHVQIVVISGTYGRAHM